MADTGNKDSTKVTQTPPYVSLFTLKTLLKNFQEHGTPGRIDRSVLPTFSGSVAGQIIPALRFLGLIDGSNHPTKDLRELVNGYGTDAWPTDLKIILEQAYEPLTKIDLKTASPSQFDEAFSKAYPGADNVIRKSKSFYLAAASEAKMPISPYIMRNKKPRSGPTKKRTPRQNGQNTPPQETGDIKSNKNPPPPPPPPAQSQATQKLSEQVLAVLDAENLPTEIETAVFALLRHLRKEGK